MNFGYLFVKNFWLAILPGMDFFGSPPVDHLNIERAFDGFVSKSTSFFEYKKFVLHPKLGFP